MSKNKNQRRNKRKKIQVAKAKGLGDSNKRYDTSGRKRYQDAINNKQPGWDSRIFVLGNGESRKSIDLYDLHQYGRVYGCNAIYRDHPWVDKLVSVDAPMQQEIIDSKYGGNVVFRSHPNIKRPGKIKTIKQELGVDRGYMSGGVLLDLAAKTLKSKPHSEIYLLGFDIFGKIEQDEQGRYVQKFNNLYADTKNYHATGSAPITTMRWSPMVLSIILENPHLIFYRVQDDTCMMPKEWAPYPRNLVFLPIEAFWDTVKGYH